MSARIRVVVAPEIIEQLRAQADQLGWTIHREEDLDSVGLILVDVHAAKAPRHLDGHLVSPVIARNYPTGEVYVLSYGDPLDEGLVDGLRNDPHTGGT